MGRVGGILILKSWERCFAWSDSPIFVTTCTAVRLFDFSTHFASAWLYCLQHCLLLVLHVYEKLSDTRSYDMMMSLQGAQSFEQRLFAVVGNGLEMERAQRFRALGMARSPLDQ